MILDGKKVQEYRKNKLLENFSKMDKIPSLSIIQVGNKNESNIYINQKIKFGEKLGVKVEHVKLPEDVTEEKIWEEIEKINKKNDIGGTIIQLPLPDNLDEKKIVDMVVVEKDVDGLTSENLGRLLKGDGRYVLPATSKGIKSLFEYYEITLAGKRSVVIGRSMLVGKPVSLLLLSMDSTVTIAHSKTENLDDLIRGSEVVISAVGCPGLLNKSNINKNQIIIDVGTTMVSGSLKGDADFEEIKDLVTAITPVPGGVGPLTVISLFENLYDLSKMN